MVGICSWGAYVPLYRLSKAEIAKAWGKPPIPGERSVASFDEDSLSMAVEAAIDCIRGVGRKEIEGLYFASTTSPFKEKQAAATAAAALNLRRDILVLDCCGSLRAGTIALRCAVDTVRAGSAKKILVTASDCRMGIPKSTLEQNLGDGAAAFLVGDSEVAVEIENFYSISDEFTDIWRNEDDKFVNTWEDRFILTEGYQRVISEAVSEALKRADLTPQDFTRVVFYGPDDRSLVQVARTLGFDPRTQFQDHLFNELGNTGAAFPLMILVAFLEEAKAGDRVLLASYGNGSDVFILRVTEEIERVRKENRRGMKVFMASKQNLPNYQKYVSFRSLMETETSRMPPVFAPATVIWRDQDSILRFLGSKCKHCGNINFPIQRICSRCHSKDEFDKVDLSEKKARIFTYTLDTLGFNPAAPEPLWVIVDFEGGVRVRMQLVDADLNDVAINTEVETTFRKFPLSGKVPVYSWRCRLIR